MELSDVKFACLDTETTGLKFGEGGKICEIAVSVSQNGRVLEEFSTLINPTVPISPAVIAIHGITNDMVKDSPKFEDVVAQLLGLFDGCVLVAHNTGFDIPFIRAEFNACGVNLPPYPVIDTLKLARRSGLFTCNRLGAVAQQLGFSCEGWHRAMADTKMAEKILYYFINTLHQRGVHTLEQLDDCQCNCWPEVMVRK